MKVYLGLIVGIALLTAAGPAWSDYFVGTTDVGNLDTLVTSPNNPTSLANSGDQTEINWVNSVLSSSFTKADLVKYDMGSGHTWVQTTTTGVWALQLGDHPADFYIKTGNIGTGKDHFLFQNNADTGWAVVSLASMGITNNDAGKFSHVGEVGASVPEPSSLMLLGLGLIGAGGVAKRKIKK